MDTTYMLLLGAVAVVVSYGLGVGWSTFVVNRPKPDLMQYAIDELKTIKDTLEAKETPSTHPQDIDPSLVERVEAVERRMEVVHADCMKYLSKAKAAEGRMQQTLDIDNDEGDLTREQAQDILAQDNSSSYTSPADGQPGLRRDESMTLAEIERAGERL